MKTENIKNKINCEKFDMKKLSIKELKHLKNQAKSLKDKRMKRKCKYKIWDKMCIRDRYFYKLLLLSFLFPFLSFLKI